MSKTNTKQDLRLQRIKLKNFKGIKDLTVALEGDPVQIFGANEVGKTTIGDAIMWLLVGTDLLGRQPDAFDIKTQDESGKVIHDIEHSVEGIFNDFTLKKVYKERWNKKRGEMAGHTTDYYVDGFEKKKGEYESFLGEFADTETIKRLMIPGYFTSDNHTDWKTRRQILSEITEPVTIEDVIASGNGLEEVPALLGKYSETEILARTKSDLRELRGQLNDIQPRIDEATMAIVEIENLNELKAKLETLNKTREKKAQKLQDAKADGGASELRLKHKELEVKKREVLNRLEEQEDERLRGYRKQVTEAEGELDQADQNCRQAKRTVEEITEEIASVQRSIDNLSKQREAAEQAKPKPKAGDKECSLCGQAVEGQSEEDYQAYVENFNEKKAERIKSLRDDLDSAQSLLSKKQSTLDDATATLKRMESLRDTAKKNLEAVQASLAEAKQSTADPAEHEDYKAIIARQDELTEAIEKAELGLEESTQPIREEMARIDEMIADVQGQLSQESTNKRQRQRVSELEEKRLELSKQIEDKELDIALIGDYIRQKSNLITQNINKLFDKVHWELFEDMVTVDEPKEVCEAYYKGVKVNGGLNTAGMIQAGMEVIDVLASHYGLDLPVIVDNRESVTSIPDYAMQVISLIVSPEDKKLRVKKELQAAGVA